MKSFVPNYFILFLITLFISQNVFSETSNEVYLEMDVLQLQKSLSTGKITSKQLVEFYFHRIKNLDNKLNSIIEINPDAIAIAEQMDKERKEGKIRSKMHGIPFVIKDNIDTADKMKTTAGSLALLDAPNPKQDAFIVKQLRNSGAILIAKTNLSEWANMRSESSSSGWSARGGQTHNPYILDRSPCGSSAGTAVAVTTNFTAVGIGTETDGSIICPAAFNGIVGLKPTLGLVSRAGIIPLAHSQDTAGPMTRTVTDAAIMLNIIQGADSIDSITLINPEAIDYTAFLNKDGLKGKRIGVMKQKFGGNTQLDKLMEKNLKLLGSQGAILIDVEFPELNNFADAEYEVLLYEFKHDLNNYLSKRGGEYDSLEKLIQFNKDNASKEMPYFDQLIFEKAQAKGDLRGKNYLDALAKSKLLTQDKGIDLIMNQHHLDAIVGPSNAQPWLIDLISGDDFNQDVSSYSMPAVAGYPNITVPAGFLNDLPIGISFFGKAFSDGTLIQIAYAFEQASQTRRQPKFFKTYEYH
jgi:amidase